MWYILNLKNHEKYFQKYYIDVSSFDKCYEVGQKMYHKIKIHLKNCQ